MIKNIINKIHTFIYLDIDWKLIKLGKVLNIKIYPHNNTNYIRNFYDLLILKFFYTGWRKVKYSQLLKLKKIQKNQIIIPERSGSHFIRNTLNSYLGSLHNKENNFFYNEKNDNFVFKYTYIVASDYWNFNPGFEPSFLEKVSNKIFLTRYPHGRKSSFFAIDKNSNKTIVIIRKPIDVIKSYFFHKNEHCNNSQIMEKLNNVNYLTQIIRRNETFLLEMLKAQIGTNNLKKINFEDIIKNPEKYFREILKFYKIDLNIFFLTKALKENHKDNYKKIIGTRHASQRLTSKIDNDTKIIIDKKISNELSQNNKFKNVSIYNELIK